MIGDNIPSSERVCGVVAVLVGGVLLVAHPMLIELRPVSGFAEGGAISPAGLALEATFHLSGVALVPAVEVTWGLAAAWTGRVKSLTPRRALFAVPLVFVQVALVTLADPNCFEACHWWSVTGTGADTVGSVATRTLGSWRSVFAGAVLFVAVGAATRRGDRQVTRWCASALAGYALVFWLVADVSVLAVVAWPVLASALGVPALVVGYGTGTVLEDGSPERNSETLERLSVSR